MARSAKPKGRKKDEGKEARETTPSVAVLASAETPQALTDAVLQAVSSRAGRAVLTDPAARFTAGLLICLDGGGVAPWKLSTLRERPAKSILYALIDHSVLLRQGDDPMALGTAVLAYGEFSSSDSAALAMWTQKRC